MTSKAPVFEESYQGYLARLAGLDLTRKQDLLGIRVEAQTVAIPFFNDVCKVTPRNITNQKGRLHPSGILKKIKKWLT
ncbi:MAG: hypothetical protein R6V15_06520 [Desulfotignum sp.]